MKKRRKMSRAVQMLAVPSLWALLAGCLLGGCMAYEIDDLNRTIRVAPSSEPPVSSVDLTGIELLRVAGESQSPSQYVLGAGDVVQLSVFQLDTLGEDRVLRLTVGEDGTVMVPLIGQVKAEGQTVTTLAAEVRRRLAKDYIYDPRVKAEVAEHRSRVAAVMGAVHRPGRYPVRGRSVVLLNLLGEAGGVTGEAGDEVTIVRRALAPDRKAGTVPDSQPPQRSITVRLSRLVHEGSRAAPVLIYPGDLVTVSRKESSRFYIAGHVGRPGTYHRPADMTLLQALTVAGGLSETADPCGLKIVRQLPRGGEELIEVDLKKIAAGEVPDVRIRPADLVVVPSTPQRRAWADVRRFFHGLFSVGVDARYNVLD